MNTTIPQILSRYGIARSTYTLRKRGHRERLAFDPYTFELMATGDVATIARCLRASGVSVREMGRRSLYVAA